MVVAVRALASTPTARFCDPTRRSATATGVDHDGEHGDEAQHEPPAPYHEVRSGSEGGDLPLERHGGVDMFTTPSLSELLEGVSKTAEDVLLPELADSPVADRLIEVLMVLDRVSAEWSSAAHHFAADNDDIRETLARIGQPAPHGEQAADGSAASLAAENRRLKAALIAAIEALDLPAAPGDPAARLDADLEVRRLLGRVLRREREANPSTPTRVNPLSRTAQQLADDERARMTAALETFIAGETPDATDVRVSDLKPLAGGASREAFTFDATWSSGSGPIAERCVMLRQPVSSVLESDESETRITGSRRVPQVEFRMIRCIEASGIPVPHMLWVEPTGSCLDRPFSVARLITGNSDLSKLGAEPHLDQILQQYIEILARVHTVDPSAAGVDFLGDPSRETAAAEQVELFAEGVERQRLEDFPALTYVIRWLRKHKPVASRVSVIHGDFRLGNFMWDDDGIVAMLDWEQCHLGDPLEELAFMYWPMWTLEPLVPLEQLVRRYEEASGITVDPDALAYYRVFIELKMSVVVLTGIKSFYATPERQLAYGATLGFELLRECQLRVIDELLDGGPTMHFRAGAASQPA
jgi:aminoglycoside phosphotransferase (APT) family kinase protein